MGSEIHTADSAITSMSMYQLIIMSLSYPNYCAYHPISYEYCHYHSCWAFQYSNQFHHVRFLLASEVVLYRLY